MRLNLVDHKFPEFVESCEIALKIGLNFNSSLWSGGGGGEGGLQVNWQWPCNTALQCAAS